MKNVENIQIQGEKQRAIYYLVEKNEKWFFRSLYPFHPVKDTAAWVVVYFCFKKPPVSPCLTLYLKSFWHSGTVVRGPKLSWHKHRILAGTQQTYKYVYLVFLSV